jgi:hypothetical protein
MEEMNRRSGTKHVIDFCLKGPKVHMLESYFSYTRLNRFLLFFFAGGGGTENARKGEVRKMCHEINYYIHCHKRSRFRRLDTSFISDPFFVSAVKSCINLPLSFAMSWCPRLIFREPVNGFS